MIRQFTIYITTKSSKSLIDEPFASFLGMRLTKLGPGTAEAELIPIRPMLNSHGTVHGQLSFHLQIMYSQLRATHMAKQQWA